jgi:hypothetical protein
MNAAPKTRLGIVDLDTSHPAAWIPIERELGCEIAGVWDGGAVHPAGYARTFAREHGIARVFENLAEMAAGVDAVVLHGCDWDTHVARARPFVEAGKAVLIDKPLAGNLADLRQLARWADEGARIFGGSALRHARELAAWQALPPTQRGVPRTALCGCATDAFNYGIHAYTFLCAALGPGVRSARHLGADVQERVEVRWHDGRVGWVVVGEAPGGWIPFYGTLVTDRTVVQMQPKPEDLYRAFLEQVIPRLATPGAAPPCAFSELIEPALAALAALQSKRSGGREVCLADIRADTRHDGAAFSTMYRKSKYA